MFGQSFLNRFTPMNAGGMAMRVRYLQKGGTDVAVAATAVGIDERGERGDAGGPRGDLRALGRELTRVACSSFPDVSMVAVVVVVAALFIGLGDGRPERADASPPGG